MSSGLITPNFSSGRHTDYMEQLSRQYATLSKLEVPEESLHEVDDPRILALRERIKEALSRAEGNPASGKWIRITRLLRMGVTSGRGGKWVGARADLKPPECPDYASGWMNTLRESEWMEWEHKFVQDRRLKNMVETWKKGVEDTTTNHPESISTKNQTTKPHPTTKDSRRPERPILQLVTGVTSDKQNTKSMPTAVSIGPLKDSAPFGFGVVKRTSQINVLNGKPHASGNKTPHSRPGLPAVPEAPEPLKEADKRSSRGPKEGITISGVELSSMHPSFSGPQLLTSTPKKTAKPTKTSHPAQPNVSSPLTPLISSPSKMTLLGRASSLASRSVQSKTSNRGVPSATSPAISSLRHTTSQRKDSDTPDLLNTNNKRVHSSSHSYPVAEVDGRISKKAKIIPSNQPTPKTPPRAPPGQIAGSVPTLTELLASAKKAKRKRPQRKEVDHEQHSTSEPRLQAQAKGDGEEATPFFDASLVDEGGGSLQEPLQPEYDFYAHLDDLNAAKSPSPIPDASRGEEREDIDQGGGIDNFVLDSSFRPLATSTQVPPDHERRRGGPIVSNVDIDKPVITQPDNPPPPGEKSGNAADSWASIYAPPPPPPPPRQGNSAFPGISAASSGNNNDDDTSFPQLSYNTQFNSAIAAEVEKVNKLLQRDVDYGGLNDTSVKHQGSDEEHDDSGDSSLDGGGGLVKDGRNGYSYGYGKAFEYDQSF